MQSCKVCLVRCISAGFVLMCFLTLNCVIHISELSMRSSSFHDADDGICRHESLHMATATIFSKIVEVDEIIPNPVD